MIEHRYRFHGHGSIRHVYRQGRTVRGRYVNVRYQNNPNRVHNRVAVVVSKKVFKAATKRNLIRRQIYEALRRNWPAIQPANDLVFTVFDAKIITLNPRELERELGQVLAGAKVLAHGEKS
jgi:ribonuclease P protein component